MRVERYSKEITDELWSLLLQADPDESAVREYLGGSTILVARDNESIFGIAVIVTSSGQAELKNIAVRENYQGRGIAKLLIVEAKKSAKLSGFTSIKVGTGNSSLSQLALYQKCGFRMQSIDRDFFQSYSEPIFENGIQCLDMVVLSAEL